MFIAALIIIAQNWKKPKCPSAGEWLNKLWYIHTIEWHSKIKRNKILIHVITWMSLKSVMLKERSQTPRTTSCMIPFIWHSRENNTVVMTSRSVVSGGQSWGRETDCKGHEALSDVTEMIYIFVVVVVTWLYTLVKIHPTVHLKCVTFTVYKWYLCKANKKEKIQLCYLQNINLKPFMLLK